jgi:hypothetical protein
MLSNTYLQIGHSLQLKFITLFAPLSTLAAKAGAMPAASKAQWKCRRDQQPLQQCMKTKCTHGFLRLIKTRTEPACTINKRDNMIFKRVN